MINSVGTSLQSPAQVGGTRSPHKNDGGGFKELDSDGNGTINSEEFAKLAEIKGNLSADELKKKFENVDTDGNGELTKEEMKAARERHDARSAQLPSMGQDGEFMSQLKTAVTNSDDTTIKALLEKLKMQTDPYGIDPTSTGSALTSGNLVNIQA